MSAIASVSRQLIRLNGSTQGVNETPVSGHRWSGCVTGQRICSPCACVRRGIVSTMDKIATATMNRLNINAIIAATRTVRLNRPGFPGGSNP